MRKIKANRPITGTKKYQFLVYSPKKDKSQWTPSKACSEFCCYYASLENPNRVNWIIYHEVNDAFFCFILGGSFSGFESCR
jgi:hypothetical protein